MFTSLIDEEQIELALQDNPNDWRNLLGILADVRRELGHEESADMLNCFLLSGEEVTVEEITDDFGCTKYFIVSVYFSQKRCQPNRLAETILWCIADWYLTHRIPQ